MNIARAIQQLFPDAKEGVDFIVASEPERGQYIAEWNLEVPQPTSEDLQTAYDAYCDEIEAVAYRAKRSREYPPVGDQLDAIWKGGDAADAMKDAVMAVKAKYPKPEGAE